MNGTSRKQQDRTAQNIQQTAPARRVADNLGQGFYGEQIKSGIARPPPCFCGLPHLRDRMILPRGLRWLRFLARFEEQAHVKVCRQPAL